MTSWALLGCFHQVSDSLQSAAISEYLPLELMCCWYPFLSSKFNDEDFHLDNYYVIVLFVDIVEYTNLVLNKL